VATASEIPATWKILVEDRLVAAEKAMRYLLLHFLKNARLVDTNW
jgi:hypothetical protein